MLITIKIICIFTWSNYLLIWFKKITHMWRKWDTTQNFFLAFNNELEKQIIIKKTVEVGQ